MPNKYPSQIGEFDSSNADFHHSLGTFSCPFQFHRQIYKSTFLQLPHLNTHQTLSTVLCSGRYAPLPSLGFSFKKFHYKISTYWLASHNFIVFMFALIKIFRSKNFSVCTHFHGIFYFFWFFRIHFHRSYIYEYVKQNKFVYIIRFHIHSYRSFLWFSYFFVVVQEKFHTHSHMTTLLLTIRGIAFNLNRYILCYSCSDSWISQFEVA